AFLSSRTTESFKVWKKARYLSCSPKRSSILFSIGSSAPLVRASRQRATATTNADRRGLVTVDERCEAGTARGLWGPGRRALRFIRARLLGAARKFLSKVAASAFRRV